MNVTLRKFQEGDFGAFMKCHGPEGLGTIVPAEEAIFRKFFELYRQDSNQWAVDLDGNWAGHIGFKNPRNEGVAEVGYNIAPAFQRRGVATAALGQLVRLAFQNRVLKLWARTTVLNVPSIKLLERAGFRKEGHLRNQRAVQGDAGRRGLLWADAGGFP